VGLWFALDCLDDEAVAAGVLICSDSQRALNALTESGYSAHSVLAPLRARLRGLKGCVCFQWVPAYCGLLRNERADEEARKAADLGPADGVQRGRISFEVVKGLIWTQVKDGPHNHARTLLVYGDGPFSRPEGVSMDSLKFHPALPCLTLIRPAGRPPPKCRATPRPQGGRPAAVFFPLGYPFPYGPAFQAPTGCFKKGGSLACST
jgi:hypothetical protein